MLAALPVKGRAPKTGYDRDEFGSSWRDIDRNGCDTRNDVLNRDLTAVTHKPGTGDCKVTTGTLNPDPYTGKRIAFTAGVSTSSDVQIDHVVALSDAWQTGAQQLTPAQREALANDPVNLLAVDGPANAQKSDSNAASWLPANTSFRCAYVARQIAVKAKYTLWVVAPEKAAMARVLATCPNQKVPADTGKVTGTGPALKASAKPKPKPSAKPKPSPTSKPAVSFANCGEVSKAGKAPLYKGQPGYAPKLDRDGDGIACDTTGAPAAKKPTSSPTKKQSAPKPRSPRASTSTRPKRTVTPKPRPQPAASFANCDAVRAAGKAPIYRGQPGYAPKLDRDKDGIGCDVKS